MPLTSRSVAHARWVSHVNGVNPPAGMRAWLTDTASLTRKLTACSGQFRVRLLRQQHGRCLADEFKALELPRRCCVQEREVLLQCDGSPMVFAHTIVPLSTNASDWPFFRALGERPLGASLFSDPRIVRGPSQYARLPVTHPLVRRASSLLGTIGHPLYARRCLYRRKHGALLVTEVFLPAIAGLRTSINETNKRSI